MFKNNRILILTSILALFMCAISFVVFAAFETSQTYDTTVSTHTISNQTVTGPESTPLSISNDSFTDTEYTLTNTDAMNYVYSYTMSVISGYTNELNTIFVYVDGTFAGTLADYTLSGKDLNLNKIVFASGNDKTKISYKSHNPNADFSITATVTLTATIKTPDVVNYYFVSSLEELKLAIDDINVDSYRSVIPTIVLTNNIATTSSYTISDSCRIDLCGNTLTLGNTINIASDVHIYDSKGNGSVVGDSSYLVVEGVDALLTSDVDIANSMVSITSISSTKLINYLSYKLSTYDYLISGTSYNLFGFEAIYFNTYASLSFDGSDVEDVTNIIIASSTTNEVLSYQITSNTIEASGEIIVYGDDEATLLDNILANDLVHLSRFSGEGYTKVNYDLYLPTAIKQYGVTISWWSSDDSVMSNDGKLHQTQGNIEIVATIKIFDKVYTKTYHVRGAKQDDMDKLLYLAGKIELTLNLTSVGTPVNLPTVDNYQTFYEVTSEEGIKTGTIEDLGIEEIAYSLESAYYYVTYSQVLKTEGSLSLINTEAYPLSSASIFLNQVTFQKLARIKIQAKFANNDEILETYMKITINVSPSDIADKIYSYIHSYLNSVDVLQNILDTRKEHGVLNETGDFDLPNVYEEFKIEYFFKDSEQKEVYTSGPITLVTNPDTGIQTVRIDLENLNLTQTRIAMYARVYVGDVTAAEQLVYFLIPPAITKNNFTPFATLKDAEGNVTDAGEIFYNLKLQSILQSTANAKFDSSTNLDAATYTQVTSLDAYILLYDVENTQELYFEFGRINTVLDRYALEDFTSLLNWAVGTTIAEIPSDVKSQLNKTITWIKSDGNATLSDEEIYVILHYAQRFPAFQSVWDDYINVLDNIISDTDYNELLSIIIDPYFSTILEWVTTSTDGVISIDDYLISKGVIEDATTSPFNGTNIGSEVNNNAETITNEEERVIVYYVLENKDRTTYDAFYAKWKEYIKRNADLVTGDTFPVKLNTAIQSYHYKSDKTEETYTLKQCYDPLFTLILEWALYSYSGNTDNASLGNYLNGKIDTNNSLYGLLDDTTKNYQRDHANHNNNKLYSDMITPDEFFVIRNYVTKAYYNKDYDSSNPQNICPFFNVYTKSGEDYVAPESGFAHYTSSSSSSEFVQYYYTIDNVNYKEINAESYYTYRTLWWDTHVRRQYLLKTYLDAIIDFVNESYQKLLADETADIQNVYTWATSKNVLEFKNGYYNDCYGKDGNYRISYDEYSLLKTNIEHFYGSFASTQLTSSLINPSVKNYVIGSLGVDMTFGNDPNSISTEQKTNIMNAVDPQADFDEIILYVTSLGSSAPVDGSYYDNLPTISLEEFKKIVEFIKESYSPTKAENFITKLNSVITTYNYNSATSTYSTNANVDRTLGSIDNLKADVNGLIGNSDESLKYMYIPIDKITDTAPFEAIKYYTELTTIAFRGNSLDSLFETNVMANNLFALVCNSRDTLQKVTFNYTKLSSIDYIENLVNLEYIDFRGNESIVDEGTQYFGISDLTPLLDLLAKKNEVFGYATNAHDHKLLYMNFYMTDVDFYKEEYKFIKLYLAYKDSNPTYYYNLNEVETLYKPNINDNQIPLVEALFTLRLFEDITYKYYFLPNYIYYSSTTYEITWTRVSGAYTVNKSTVAGKDTWRINRPSTSNETNIIYASENDCMILATISDGTYSYTRYFKFNMVEYIETIS